MLDQPEPWRRLGTEAMRRHDVDFAMRVFRHVGDVGMVWSLEEFRDLEDKKLLAGHVCMILGEYDQAQALYLQSGTPTEALHMRRDLLHWDQALRLATKLAPDQIRGGYRFCDKDMLKPKAGAGWRFEQKPSRSSVQPAAGPGQWRTRVHLGSP